MIYYDIHAVNYMLSCQTMFFKSYLFRITLLLFCGTCCVSARQCYGRDQCSCAFDDDQSVIALHSLANRDLTPKWKYLSFTDGNKYSYNPCFPFDEGNCAQAAACMTDSNGDSQNIGDSQTATFEFKSNKLFLGYTAGEGVVTVTQVVLVCDPHMCEPELILGGQTGQNSYQFTLTSVCACPNGCNETGPISCIPSAAPETHLATTLHITVGIVVSYWLGFMR